MRVFAMKKRNVQERKCSPVFGEIEAVPVMGKFGRTKPVRARLSATHLTPVFGGLGRWIE